MLPKEKAHKLINVTAAKAVKQCDKIKPYKIASPVKMKLELVERGQIPNVRPGLKISNGRTYEVTASTVEQALQPSGL